MKKITRLPLVVCLCLLICASCSSGGGDDTSTAPSVQNSWKMNTYSFSRRVSTQVLSNYTNGAPFTQINVDSNISSTNNNFKACNLIFWFNTQSTGVYTAKSVETVVGNVALNYMNIKCIVTDTAGHGAIYESTDSEVSLNVDKINNDYVVTGLNLITLSKTSDDGLSNAPATMTFICNKVK